MAFKNLRNLLLINHNSGFIDIDEFVVLYDLYASKNFDLPYDSFWAVASLINACHQMLISVGLVRI